MTEPNKLRDISKEDLSKIILFIRHNMFLPENEKLKELKKMILALLPQPEEKEFNPQSMDAVVWAKEFMRLYWEKNPKQFHYIDEDLMSTWFANAIMAGFDEARRRYEKPQPEVMSEEEIEKIIKDNVQILPVALLAKDLAHALANKIPVERYCECPHSDIINEIQYCNSCGKPIKQPAKMELPEEGNIN